MDWDLCPPSQRQCPPRRGIGKGPGVLCPCTDHQPALGDTGTPPLPAPHSSLVQPRGGSFQGSAAWRTLLSPTQASSLWASESISPTLGGSPPCFSTSRPRGHTGPAPQAGALAVSSRNPSKACQDSASQGTLLLALCFLSSLPRGLLCGPRTCQLSGDLPVRREGQQPPGSSDCVRFTPPAPPCPPNPG